MKGKLAVADILLFSLIGYGQRLQKASHHPSIKVALDVVLVPVTTTPDGKWRKFRVKVKPPAGVSHVSVRARAGFYAQTVD